MNELKKEQIDILVKVKSNKKIITQGNMRLTELLELEKLNLVKSTSPNRGGVDLVEWEITQLGEMEILKWQ